MHYRIRSQSLVSFSFCLLRCFNAITIRFRKLLCTTSWWLTLEYYTVRANFFLSGYFVGAFLCGRTVHTHIDSNLQLEYAKKQKERTWKEHRANEQWIDGVKSMEHHCTKEHQVCTNRADDERIKNCGFFIFIHSIFVSLCDAFVGVCVLLLPQKNSFEYYSMMNFSPYISGFFEMRTLTFVRSFHLSS